MNQQEIGERELPQVAGEAVATADFAGERDLAETSPGLPAGVRLLALLTLEAAAFALASASGKMPVAVVQLFRALLTL
jgi:hypothetical protein